MKKNLVLLSIIATAIISAAAIVSLIDFQDGTKEKGFLEGTVTFIGTPCSEKINHSVPPCDGIYPNYEVIVYKTDGKTIVAKTVSDENGNYKISLKPGNYIIYTQNGPFKDDVELNRVIIVNGKITKLDLIIDTGIR